MTPGAAYGGNAAAGFGSYSRVPHPAQQAQDDLYSRRSTGIQTGQPAASVGTQTLSGGMNRATQTAQTRSNAGFKSGIQNSSSNRGVAAASQTSVPKTPAPVKPASHSVPNSNQTASQGSAPIRDSGFSGTTGKGPDDRLREGLAGGEEGLISAAADQFNEDTGRIGYGVGRSLGTLLR